MSFAEYMCIEAVQLLLDSLLYRTGSDHHTVSLSFFSLYFSWMLNKYENPAPTPYTQTHARTHIRKHTIRLHFQKFQFHLNTNHKWYILIHTYVHDMFEYMWPCNTPLFSLKYSSFRVLLPFVHILAILKYHPAIYCYIM